MKAAGAAVNRPMITLCVMAATIMQALDTTIANVATPYMQGSFSASQDQINWVLTSYIVAAAIMTPPTGWLANHLGRKRLFLISVVGFTIASALCGLASSLTQIVAFRLMQGLFGAALVPLSQSVLLDIYPREKQGAAMAMWGVGVTVGPILGPALGGFLTENFGWRWVFYINLPVGVLTYLGISSFLEETRRGIAGKFDWFGFGMLSLAVGSLQMMLDRGELLDWFSSLEIVIEGSVAVVAFYLFVVHTATAGAAGKGSFLSAALFRDRNCVAGMVATLCVGVVLYASLSLISPFLQTLLGYPVVSAGLIIAPRGMGTMLAMLLVGRIVRFVDPRHILLAGFALTAFALWRMSLFNLNVSEGTLIWVGVLQGFGLGLLFAPLSAVSFSTLPAHLRTEAAGLFSLMRNVGGSVGIAIVTSLLVSNTQANRATIGAHVTAFEPAFKMEQVLRFWNPFTAQGQAALADEISRQASLIAYLDNFRLLMAIALLSMPAALLLKTPKNRKPGQGKAPPPATPAVAD